MMSSITLPTLVSLCDDGRSLQLRFTSRGDRLGHELAIVSADPQEPALVICSSHEGTEHDAWPPSPPLQSVSVSEHAGWPVALLVGMAGRSHWSASFLIMSAGRMRIELACRVGGMPPQLGSVYHYDPALWQWQMESAEVGRLVSDSASLHWHVHSGTRLQPDSLSIVAPQPWDRQPVAWTYEITLLKRTASS